MISERNAPPDAAFEAVRRGWQGYFPANESLELLIAAIRLIAFGGLFIPGVAIHACVSRLWPERS